MAAGASTAGVTGAGASAWAGALGAASATVVARAAPTEAVRAPLLRSEKVMAEDSSDKPPGGEGARPMG